MSELYEAITELEAEQRSLQEENKRYRDALESAVIELHNSTVPQPLDVERAFVDKALNIITAALKDTNQT